MTSKEYERATVEKIVLKLVFLSFLNIRKRYYKPQQYLLKPPTENDTVSFREPASFLFLWNYSFRNTFKDTEFSGKTLKQVFRIHFPEFSLLTYFLLTMNY